MILESNNLSIEKIEQNAMQAAQFLKGLASHHRLLILCRLVEGEKNVTELIEATSMPQTSMSQHLSKLKQEGIVTVRREHRTLYYRIENTAALKIMNILYDEFCKENEK